MISGTTKFIVMILEKYATLFFGIVLRAFVLYNRIFKVFSKVFNLFQRTMKLYFTWKQKCCGTKIKTIMGYNDSEPLFSVFLKQ